MTAPENGRERTTNVGTHWSVKLNGRRFRVEINRNLHLVESWMRHAPELVSVLLLADYILPQFDTRIALMSSREGDACELAVAGRSWRLLTEIWLANRRAIEARQRSRRTTRETGQASWSWGSSGGRGDRCLGWRVLLRHVCSAGRKRTSRASTVSWGLLNVVGSRILWRCEIICGCLDALVELR